VVRDTVTRRLAHEPFGHRPHDAAGAGTPLSVRLVREDVAAGHLEGGCATGEDLPGRAGVGTAGHRGRSPHRKSRRRGAGGVLAYREQRDPRRRQATSDR
jgi:hypothetical protein